MLHRTKAELNKIANLDREWVKIGDNHLVNKKGHFIVTLNAEDVDYICNKKSYTEMNNDLPAKFIVDAGSSSRTLRRTSLVHRTENGYVELLTDENNNLYGFNEDYNVLLKTNYTYDIWTDGKNMPLHFVGIDNAEHIIILPVNLDKAERLKNFMQSMKL